MVCLKHNCLIIQESKFDELCGLQKTVVSRAIFAACRATIIVTLALLVSGHEMIFSDDGTYNEAWNPHRCNIISNSGKTLDGRFTFALTRNRQIRLTLSTNHVKSCHK